MKDEGYDVTGITLKFTMIQNSQKKEDSAAPVKILWTQKECQKTLISIMKFILSKKI